MNDLAEKLVASSRTSLIDGSLESMEDLRPKLLFNDSTKGNAVLCSLSKELNDCDSFIFSVAFITMSGITVLLENLKELEEKGIKGRILTTNYLSFSEPKAFKKLMEFSNIEVRVFTKEQFHTKGYIFKNEEKYTFIVGSSNITQAALKKNKEWNLRITSLENGELIIETLNELEEMWQQAETLTIDWIEDYSIIYKQQHQKVREQKIIRIKQHTLKPNRMQIEAVRNLNKLREQCKDKAILVSATGTGKTYLSAFDARNYNPKKLLFLVHREQILKQAEDSFKDVFGESISTGFLSGNSKDIDADYLFSTVQMMSRDYILNQFKQDYFDYIIIDETHKAGAESYSKIMNHFKPRFLLGMTATPERMDGFNIFELFDYNIAYEIRLQQAMEEDMLCPFHYFGISELTIDGVIIDDVTDFRKLVSNIRVDNIINKIEFYGYCGERVKGLIFCSRQEEARELSRQFNLRGYYTVALCGDATQGQREEAIVKLEQADRNGGLDYIFTVDIFNEGVDIPSINQVVMLRPTQSSIIFIQQLGRGLRKQDEKEYVVVIDFIGNYKKNFLIPIALSGDRTYNKDTIRKYVAEGNRIIPGCSTVNFDRISRERIYESINVTTFSNLKLLKEEYLNLKNKIGRIPTLIDFYENGAIDPLLILDYSKSYYNFLKRVENDYLEVLTVDEQKMLEFVSTQLASGKRPHELLILKNLIQNEFIDINDIRYQLEQNYSIYEDDRSIELSVELLSGGFLAGSDKVKYESCIFAERKRNMLNRCLAYSRGLNNSEFLKLLEDLIDYGLRAYETNYTNRYGNTNLSLYKKYSRKEVCRLLNWDNDESSTVYGYRIKHGTCPIFVTYNKSNDISGSTKYADHFIDKNTFSWMTKNNRTKESKDVKDILGYKENGLDIHLFIKKADGEGRDFYYLGQLDPIPEASCDTSIKNDGGDELPIVNIIFKMRNQVKEDIYEYLMD